MHTNHTQNTEPSGNYESRQFAENKNYREEWKKAPQSWRDKVTALGLKADCSGTTASIELHEDASSVSYTPDMAADIDTFVDEIVERLGMEHEKIIRATAMMLKGPMDRESERNRGMMLGKVAGYLIKAEKRNVLARVHQLLHAIPGLAAIYGFPSMRASARECVCSPEWVKRGRDEWCHALGIPIPVEGQKSAAAKLKYRLNAQGNHWRKRKFIQTTTNHTIPCTTSTSNPNSPSTSESPPSN